MISELEHCKNILVAGGTLIYPTDTIWGIGCDASNAAAVELVYKIKKRSAEKPLLLLVSSLEMLRSMVGSLSEQALKLINEDRPTTIIYPRVSGIAENVSLPGMGVGIRLVKSGFCHDLVQLFGRAITSTSANFSGAPSPGSFVDLSERLKASVSHVVTEEMETATQGKASRIVLISESGELKILRD